MARNHKSIESVEAYFNQYKEAIASYMIKKCKRAEATGKYTDWWDNHYDMVCDVLAGEYIKCKPEGWKKLSKCKPEGWEKLSKEQQQLDAQKFTGYLNRLRNVNARYDEEEDKIRIIAYDYDRAENYCEYEGDFQEFQNFFDYIWTTRTQEIVNDRKLAEECAELDRLIDESDSF